MIKHATTRRTFLRTLACLGLLGFPRPGQALATLGTFSLHEPLALKLAEFFIHKRSAAIVGQEYLRGVPKEAEVAVLVDLICSSRYERRAELAQATTGWLRELLLLQQRQDFERGRTVKVHGWLLSQTEARLCGLAALI